MDGHDFWIFAYGSLMWRPDFTFAERRRARLTGFHRALCITSHHWRGTPARPGLVLGLDRGGACVGLAFRIAPDLADDVRAAVRSRELVNDCYNEVERPVLLDDGRRVRAMTYVANRRHADYAGRLAPEAVLARVRGSAGVAGPNIDYVRNTHHHLQGLGVTDPWLAAVVEAADAAPRPQAAMP